MENKILFGIMTIIFNAIGVPCFMLGKTKAGIKRFINAWLAKEQDRYHGPGVSQQQQYQGGGGRRNAPPSGADRILEMIDRGDFDE